MKIVLSVVVALFLFGCSQDDKETVKESVSTKSEIVAEKSKAIVEEVKESVADSKLVEESKAVIEKSEVVVDETVKKVEVATKEAVEEVKVVAQEVEQSVKEVISEKEEVITTASKAEPTVDGAAVYQTCVACHGANAEKKALNKSQIIKGWESKKVVAALHGYKDGTYGGVMKGVMKAQVTKLSDAQITAVAKYISSL